MYPPPRTAKMEEKKEPVKEEVVDTNALASISVDHVPHFPRSQS